MMGQNHYEEIFRAQLAKYDVHVELGMELVDFNQDGSGVRARVIRHGPEGDKEEFISADWMASAEGGRSKTLLLDQFCVIALLKAVLTRRHQKAAWDVVSGRIPRLALRYNRYGGPRHRQRREFPSSLSNFDLTDKRQYWHSWGELADKA